MTDPTDAVGESAKAVQEVAKTTGLAISETAKLGRFLSKYVEEPLASLTGIVSDKLLYYRWANQLDLMKKAEDKMARLGLQDPTRRVSLKFAIPLMENASLEDKPELRERWADLLVNAANSESGVTMQSTYIRILAALAPLEVAILDKIYALEFQAAQNLGVYTGYLPDRAEYGTVSAQSKDLPAPSEEVALALAILEMQGCINVSSSMGPKNFTFVRATVLGREFVRACTLQVGIAKD